MINVKDKKIIAYKNERTKKIAYNLRKLIIRAVMDKWSRLSDEKKNKPQAERIRIENERSDLYGALQTSICKCASCRHSDKDMEYNAPIKEWYCTQCAQEYRDYYRKEKAFYGDLYEKAYDDEDFYQTFM